MARSARLLARRGGLLLADDVGLGKSYVAAEVLRRWMHRRTAEAEVVVPGALVSQWRETLAAFGVEVPVITHESLARRPFMPVPGRRLVVVDEAHAFRNPATQRYSALAKRTAASAVLLVTATPLCNSLRDLQALLRLFARDDLLVDLGVPSIDAAFERRDRESIDAILAELVIRRERDVIEAALGHGVLERNVIRHGLPDLTEIDRLAFPLVGAAPILRRFLWRRAESSHAALAESLRRQRRFYTRALAALAAGRSLPKRLYREAFGGEEDREAFQEILFWELFAPPGDAADPAALRAEVARVDAILEKLAGSEDRKRARLVNLVAGESEPLLVFTTAAATARDLQAALLPIRPCGLITARERTRDAVIAAFRSGRIDAIVSTDLAAEGLNLQRAGVVIHYDLPWNPVRLDQRNGRAWRIGQRREVVRAVYFVPLERKSGVVPVVARKNRERRRTLARREAVSPPGRIPTLRPRLPRGAACLRLEAALGMPLPELLMRRHRAGLELLMHEMSGEFLDQERLDALIALARCAV